MQAVDGRDVDVVDDQQAAGPDVRVDEVVLQLREGVRVRSVEQCEVDRRVEREPWQGELRRAG